MTIDLESLPGQTLHCPCGQEHHVPTEILCYEEGALATLPEIVRRFISGKRINLIADDRTWAAAGKEVFAILEQGGFAVHRSILNDTAHGSPVCDDVTYEKLMDALPEADGFVAVGAGVVNDLTKWVSFDRDCRYVVVPTAASMNGFTATNVAPVLKGVKSITFAEGPVAVITEPAIIENAPWELTAAGLGDVIAKPVSTADWLINHVLLGETFCPEIADMINHLEGTYFDHPATIKAKHPAAVKALYDGLIYSGIAMTMIGTSAPASGGEHMFSHTLDMLASVDDIEHDLHGRQVGLGTLFACALYEELLGLESVPWSPLPESIDAERWGFLTDPVKQQYDAKRPLVDAMITALNQPGAWASLRDQLADQVRRPDQIRHCLVEAGVAAKLADIGIDRDRALDVVLHMHEIRKRPTVVDMAWMAGILPDKAESLVDRWLVD